MGRWKARRVKRRRPKARRRTYRLIEYFGGTRLVTRDKGPWGTLFDRFPVLWPFGARPGKGGRIPWEGE